MKRDKLTFLIAELILIVLAAFFIHKIFQEDVAQKRVAVILQNSGDTRWEGVINGLKQSAKTNNLHLIICNTDDIVSAQDERELIEEQLENDVDAFILCPAPGQIQRRCVDWLGEQKKPFVLLTEDVYTGEQPEASGYATVKRIITRLDTHLARSYYAGRRWAERKKDWRDCRTIQDGGKCESYPGTEGRIGETGLRDCMGV